ncbi:MAG: hypothetical protein WCG27_11730 [Pseudomonadota bacterium]
MAYNDLQKLREAKKAVPTQINRQYYRYLVAGNDLTALALFDFLKSKFSAEDRGILCWSALPNRPNDWSWPGPNILRGKANAGMLNKLYPHVTLEEQTDGPLFYKEQEWRSFKSRMKPETMLFEEDYFQQTAYRYRQEDLFPFLQDPSFFEVLAHEAQVKTPAKISAIIPQDMMSPANWAIECNDGTIIECEYLCWADSPLEFSNLLGQGPQERKIDDQLITWAMQAVSPTALFVQFDFDRPYIPLKNTLFLPLSYTYEQGHFIGESDIGSDGRAQARFVHFLWPEEVNEEEVGKRHHHLKKSLAKIFQISEKKLNHERVFLKTHTPCRKFDDILGQKQISTSEKIFFLGSNVFLGPGDYFEYSMGEISYLTRALLSLEQTKKTLSP